MSHTCSDVNQESLSDYKFLSHPVFWCSTKSHSWATMFLSPPVLCSDVQPGVTVGLQCFWVPLYMFWCSTRSHSWTTMFLSPPVYVLMFTQESLLDCNVFESTVCVLIFRWASHLVLDCHCVWLDSQHGTRVMNQNIHQWLHGRTSYWINKDLYNTTDLIRCSSMYWSSVT